ncbi:thiamine-phosphate pyrophosphorylase [Luteimonas cucumeris]|uniref:Thiamine-phosphate synthase n=1 Tax=Luteimonas cucumeris TaxID=985012 RepID=A0A562LEX8_9GAMM|nr:thiamine phosphate synthase [Luteimonas cucumeris]TWI06166.1 thiamine-phosphate pyrophosphorylase [Luteimonas cucumeris]
MNARWPRRGLYLLTPDLADTGQLLARVDEVLGDAALLQYRNKAADAALRREQAGALLALCRRHGVPLVINDDVALAAAIGADGVHLGEDDDDPSAARAWLRNDVLIGASCYDSIERAQRAVEAGVDYVAFGAYFPSPTKPHARRATPGLLRAAASLRVPRVAIGGITPDNAPSLIAAGADLVAVISGVFDAADPAAAARAYRDCFEA